MVDANLNRAREAIRTLEDVARFAWNDSTDLTLRLENIGGETAPPAALGYGAQPRSVYVGVAKKF